MHNKLRTLTIVLRHSRRGLFTLMLAGMAGVRAENPCEFRSGSPGGFDLEECRPAPARPEERAAALASLPSDGEVKVLHRTERQKMDAVRRVLHFHKRQEAYSLKVIDVPQAFTGLHERTILLISRQTIQLLKPEELQALAAHEIGHEYVWDEYRSAKARTDKVRLRELELVCDRIAAVTLARMMVPDTALMRALEKVFTYNREHFAVALNDSFYPSLKERRDNLTRTSELTRRSKTRLTFLLEKFKLTMSVSFLPSFRGDRLAFRRGAPDDPDLCFSAGSKLTAKCPESFVGAVAVAEYSVRLRNGRPARDFNLRERVTTLDQHPDFPKRDLFERTAPMVKGIISDIQAFGYDEDNIPKADRPQQREAADKIWRVYRQELYANDDKTPFAIIEWRHTIRSITLVRADAVAPAVVVE
ncbi:MAG: M48 family metalloprotease [Bryobacteraceae bacterium]